MVGVKGVVRVQGWWRSRSGMGLGVVESGGSGVKGWWGSRG